MPECGSGRSGFSFKHFEEGGRVLPLQVQLENGPEKLADFWWGLSFDKLPKFPRVYHHGKVKADGPDGNLIYHSWLPAYELKNCRGRTT